MVLKRSGSDGREEYYCARYQKDVLTGEISISLNINNQNQVSCDTSKDATFSNDEDGNEFLGLKLSPGGLR